ncbi:hypothetical protein C3495_08825 [Clostridiaceae bacterium 14S0207]|nr:hypothetical protein C3495_08825 [Clostridiaceae bacterium 14S0207]
MDKTNKKLTRDNDENDMDYIKIANYSSFFIKVSISYKFLGENFTIESSIFPMNSINKVEYPDEVSSISIKIQGSATQQNFSNIFTREYFETDDKCFIITGTIENPVCKEVDCDLVPNQPTPPIPIPPNQQGYCFVGYMFPCNASVNSMYQTGYPMQNFMQPIYPQMMSYNNGNNILCPLMNYMMQYNK